MTYQEFKNKWIGVRCNWDGSETAECYDLAQAYIVDCLGLPASILGGCGYVGNMLVEPKLSLLLQYFDEVPFDSMNGGELIIWAMNSPACPRSHIAIFDNWNAEEKRLYFFSQGSESAPGYYKPMLKNINTSGARAFRVKGNEPEPVKINVGDYVMVNGYGTAGSDGSGNRTRTLNNEKAVVLRTDGLQARPYGLAFVDESIKNKWIDGWFKKEDIEKA